MGNKLTICVCLFSIMLFGGFGCEKKVAPVIARSEKIPQSAVKISPQVDLSPPILHSNEFGVPTPLPGPINTAGAEDSPFITPDGNTFYFFFTPDPNIPAEIQLNDGVTGIYVSENAKGKWSDPQRVILEKTDESALDGCEFVQGDIMWFCSAREGYTGINLFTAKKKNNEWGYIKYAGDVLMKDYQVGEMHITADGNKMFFHSLRTGGKGGLDIWATVKKDSQWQVPENVAAINSAEDDGWPFVSEDGKELWFTRTYQGTPAIFRSKEADGVWQKPELIVSQFAGEPTLDRAGNLYFVHHYYKNGKMLEADIYMAEKNNKK